MKLDIFVTLVFTVLAVVTYSILSRGAFDSLAVWVIAYLFGLAHGVLLSGGRE